MEVFPGTSNACVTVCSPYLQVFTLGQVTVGGPTTPEKNVTVCKAAWPHGWEKPVIVMVVMLTYVIPLAIIVASYTLILRFLWSHRIDGGVRKVPAGCRTEASESVLGGGSTIAKRRKRVAKMVAAVVILFAISWLPIHVFNLCFVLLDNFPMTTALYSLKMFAHTLSFMGSCVNPFVYTIMGDGFRKAFRESLPAACHKGGHSPPVRMNTMRRTLTSMADTRVHELNDGDSRHIKSSV